MDNLSKDAIQKLFAFLGAFYSKLKESIATILGETPSSNSGEKKPKPSNDESLEKKGKGRFFSLS